MKNYIVYKSSVSITIDDEEIGMKDVFVEIAINKCDDCEIDGEWGLYYDEECRRYINFEDIPMNNCDVADKIKEALFENYNCIDDVKVFGENGHEFTGIGTPRGDFLACYKSDDGITDVLNELEQKRAIELYNSVGMNTDYMLEDYNNDLLSINEGSDNNKYIWYMDDNYDIAINIESGEIVGADKTTELFA